MGFYRAPVFIVAIVVSIVALSQSIVVIYLFFCSLPLSPLDYEYLESRIMTYF